MGVSFIRTIIIFLLLTVSIRVMGKRQLGELEPIELTVAVLISNLAAQPLQDPGIPLLNGIVPVLTLLATQLLTSGIAVRNARVRRFLCGGPSILIDNGVIVQGEMKRNRISPDELFVELRSKDVTDISTVRYAILEANGSLSVLLYAADAPATARDANIAVTDRGLPIFIVTEGQVLSENLRLLRKDAEWLADELSKRGVSSPKDVYLMTVDSAGAVTVIKREADQ